MNQHLHFKITTGVQGYTLVGLLLLGGCSYLQVEHALIGPVAAPHNAEVTIVMDGAETPSQLQEIAILQVMASEDRQLADVIGALKQHARKLGCTHVVHVRVDRGQSMAATGTCARVAPNASSR